MATVEHGTIDPGNIHPPHNWEYADAAARTGAAGLISDDVGKLALQTDTATYWRLTDESPVTWAQVTYPVGTSSGTVAAGDHNHTGTYQPLDGDLTAIAALSPSNDDVVQRKGGAWTNRTPAQVTADLAALVGDSGSGGTKGLVPAPASGDAAAGKYLKADGTWAVPAGGGGSSPLTTKGDLYTYDTADARLPVGTDGHVLTADSGEATGVKWAASASGFADPTTTKGDLIVHGASTTRLGVGSDGQVLTADSGEAEGVKWATPGGGGTTILGALPWVLPLGVGPLSGLSSGNTLAANGGTALIPFVVETPLTLESVSVRNQDSASARSWEWRLYAEPSGGGATLDEVANANGSESFTAAAISTRTVAGAAAVDLAPGLYWLAVRNTHATNTFQLGFGNTTGNVGAMSANATQIKTIGSALASTLDAVTGWTKQTIYYGARLNGRVFAQASAY